MSLLLMETQTQEEIVEMTAEETLNEEGKAKRDKADCSHRVIEKRRRDRINNSLLQLSKLVPIQKFNKKNSGKLEKAEILEVTVQYMIEQQRLLEQRKEDEANKTANDERQSQTGFMTAFLHGFKECIADATKFFQEVEELDVSEGRCHRLIQHLKKQMQHYEKNERAPSFKGLGDTGQVWEGDDAKKNYNNNSEESQADSPQPTPRTDNAKRKSSDQSSNNNNNNSSKKQRLDAGSEAQLPTTDQSSNSGDLQANGNPDSQNNGGARNFMPFMFPNMGMFPSFPFPAGAANGMPRYPGPQQMPQFPGYGFPPSASPYFPVALPQFPYFGMNVVPGFGMVPPSDQQQQQGDGIGHPMNQGYNQRNNQSGLPNAGVPAVPNGMMNGFLPSMYTNGIHANLLAMRPRDSGYESSDRSSSKESRSETSPPSFSDDSCQSFVT